MTSSKNKDRSTPIGPLNRLEDLAELAGVSVATASRALNDSHLVNARTKNKVLRIARQHDYAGRTSFKTRQRGSNGNISLIIPTPQGRDSALSDPFFLSLIGGIGDALWECGRNLVLSHVQLGAHEQAAALIRSGETDGFIIIGQGTLHEELNNMARHDIPLVVWGAHMPEQKYCVIGSDNEQGGHRSARHLLRLGRKRIAFVGDTESEETKLRFQGYTRALKEAGIPLQEQLVQPTRFYPESGMEAIENIISSGTQFDAVVAASDTIAIGVIRSLAAHGLTVPGDVSVVGYDDVIVASYCNPALTTIRQDVKKAGRRLVRKIIRSLDGEEVSSSYIPTELIVRDSCGG